MAKRARRKTPGYRHKQAYGSEITAYLLNPSNRSCLPTKVLIDPDVDCYAKIDYHTAADVINDLQGEIIIVDGQSMMILDMMINGKQQRNLHMTVAPLDRYEMILGRRWLEESHARLKDGDLIWLDCEKKKLTNQPLVEKRSEDGCLHVKLEELRKDSLAMTDDERAQQLRELEVSEIEFLEHSDPLSSYEDTFGEIRDESQRIDDMIWQLCELEDSDQGITVTPFPPPETEENLPACQDIYESHENLEVNDSRIFELSDEVYNRSFSSCAGEDEEDCPDGQDFYLPPVVRLPEMDSFRLFRSISSFSSGTPVAPIAASKESWVAVDEDTVARPPVLLPWYRRGDKDPDEEDIDFEDILIVDASLSLETSGHDECQEKRIVDSIVVMPPPEDASFCQEKLPNRLSDEPNDEETCQPHVRLPRVTSFRPHRIDEDNFSAGIPQAPMIASKDQIVVSEDVGLVVRLPERQDLLRSLSPYLSSKTDQTNENTEEIDGRCSYPYLFFVDPVEETCLAEAAWNEEIAEPNNHHEDRNSDGVSGKTNGLDNASDCERDKLVKEMDLDYELVGNPESSDWTLERYQRTNLLDRICYGILATRPAGEKVSSLGKLLFRFPPTTLVNTVDSTCDSRQTVSTWKDTGWSSQFLRMQYSKYALRFLRTTFPREQGPLFSSMTAWFETLLDLSYRLVPLLDTG